MVETYPVDISVLDLGDGLTDYLKGFQRLSWDRVHPLDRDYLQKMDRRETANSAPIVNEWRNPDDHLLFENNEGTLAYVRHDPSAPRIYHALPFNIHFRTAAPSGFQPSQYFSLAVSQRNLTLLKKALQEKGTAISAMADLDEAGVLSRICEELDQVDGEELPVHLFHSTYVSRQKDEFGGRLDREKAIRELAQAVGSIVIATHLFSRKQIVYYQAANEVDEMFGDSALVE